MAHLNIDFPPDVAAGAQANLERRDEVVQLSSGHEETNQRWTHARRSYAAGLGIRSAEDLARVVEIFEEVRGRANSFHFKDWLDWRSAPAHLPVTMLDQPLGIGDGSTRGFQLVKRYGVVNPYLRPIALPHPASLLVAADGVRVTDFALSAVGGLVTFDTAPAAGSVLTAGFTFDVPVRFASASLSVEWAYFNNDGGAGSAPEITLLEKRLDGGE
ncbi:MAG: DUF2460 domain-containing protein [Pseudomonadota bacterium]